MSTSSTSTMQRSTRRLVAAAIGTGMVFASFAGTAASASASNAQHHGRVAQHRRAVAVQPHISPPTPTPAVTATGGAPTEVSTTTLDAGTSTALPTITIGDPGLIKSGDTITLSLVGRAGGVTLDTTAVPTVTVTGGSASPALVTATTVKFVITKATDATQATYVVAGTKIVGAATTSGAFGMNLSAGTPGNGGALPPIPPTTDATVAPFVLGAVMHLLPAAAGPTAPDTAAVLFRAEATGSPSSVVLASDYEPQDAETSSYLADNLPGNQTGILLTDPTTLSAAVTSTLADYGSINTIYIVGGTSVVSAAIATQLAQTYTVIRLAGTTAYDTNSYVVNYVAQNFSPGTPSVNLDYNYIERYNSTSGASSANTTSVGYAKTAIVASGDIKSFQDGIVSGPMSYDYGFPVILTTPGSLSSTALALLTEGSYKQVILVGGPNAVSDAVEAKLVAPLDAGGAGASVFRVAGTDASDTATKVAAFAGYGPELDDLAPKDYGSPDGGVLITRGTGFQDPLAAGPYAGDNGFTPVLLTENATVLGAPLATYLTTMARDFCVFAVQAIGGSQSVAPAVQQDALDAEFAGLGAGCLLIP